MMTLHIIPIKGSGRRSGKNASPIKPSAAQSSDTTMHTVADIIYEFGTEQIDQKLCEKEESGYQSNIAKINMIFTVKFQKRRGAKFAVTACVIKPM